MASGLRHAHDPDPRADHYTSRWPEDRENDREGFPASHRSYWHILQLEPDLRQYDLSVFECGLHPDAEGTSSPHNYCTETDRSL